MAGKFSTRFKLSKKDVKELRQEAQGLGQVPMTWDDVEEGKAGDVIVYLDSGLPCLARVNGSLIPTLTCLLRRGYSWLPYVLVDRGATQAVGRGADLMAPGVRGVVGSFDKGALVAVVDEQTKAPVAVGRALVSSDELRSMISSRSKGKVIENLHYPGDQLWKIIS